MLESLRPQAIDDLVGVDLALTERFERDEHAAYVGGRASAAAASEGQYVIHARVLLHNRRELRLLHVHRVEGDVLRCARRAAQPAGILLREEALGHDDVEIDIQHQCADRNQEHQVLVAAAPIAGRDRSRPAVR